MASQIINHTGGAGTATTSTITVGSGEKVAVRLSRLDANCEASLKIVGNSVTTHEKLDRMHTVFDSIPANHVVSVVTRRTGDGGIEGVIESYT